VTPTISVCAIVKNEERNIGDFITGFLPVVDEFLIADTGSSDRTTEIIEELAALHRKIVLYKYTSDGQFHFGKARNFIFDKAVKDYIIIADADERPSREFVEGIKDFLSKERPVVASVLRKDELLPHLIDRSNRIVQKNSNVRYGTGPLFQVHEQLEYTGQVKCFDGALWHNQRWNHYLVRPQRIFLQLELQIDRVPKTKSLLGHVVRGVWYFFYRFKKIYFKRKLYKDGKLGFKYAFMRSLDAFLIQLFVGLKPSEKDAHYWNDASHPQ
jgi:glycosyltransferase involved in cell wall biosynthesis